MTTNENWNGLQLDGIEKVMTDVLDYAERANKILNNISTLVADTASCFDCETGDEFRNQYELIRSGIATFNKNFLSYNTDLMRAIKNYQLREENSVEILNQGQRAVNVSLEQREEN